MANEYDRTQTLKRGGGQQIISFDEHLAEAEAMLTNTNWLDATGCYDRHWSGTMINCAWEQLYEEYAAIGKEQLLGALKPFLTGAAGLPSQKEVAEQVDVSSGSLRKSLLVLRQRYREVLRLMVAKTVSDPAEVDDELHYLYRLLLS